MKSARRRTVGKTPTMAFVLDYLRQFPGAKYDRVKAACQTFGVGIPATIVYGNALRVLKNESEPAPSPSSSPPIRRRMGRRRGHAVQDLSGFVEQFQAVVAERDRLRQAADQIIDVVKQLRR